MMLHLMHKEVMSKLKVLSESATLLLRSVASCIVDLFQNHPELSAMLKNFRNFFLCQKFKFLEERRFLEKVLRGILVLLKSISTKDGFEYQTSEPRGAILLEAQLLNQFLSINNVSFARLESSVEYHLKSCSPGKLEPLHIGAVLGKVKINLFYMNFFSVHIDPDLIEGDQRKDSR